LPDKICFQCGHTNPQQAFCGACGSALDLNDYIARTVREQLATAVRDRDLLETESAINVFEKAWGWVKLVAYPLGLVAAIVTGLGIWKYSDWWSSVNTAKQTVIDASTNTQKQIAQTAKDTIKTATGLSNDLKKTAAAATTDMTRQVSALQVEVVKAQSQLKTASEIQPKMVAMQNQLTQATSDIQAQQKVISSSEEFVKQVFSSHKIDYFMMAVLPAATRYATIAAPSGGKNSVVFLLLDSAPVAQTLQLQYKVFAQPPNSYITVHNLVIFFWGEDLNNLKGQQLSAAYFPDKSDKKIIHSLSFKDGRAFADGEPLPKFNQPDPDFKGDTWFSPDLVVKIN
jgi:hypothetical protein